MYGFPSSARLHTQAEFDYVFSNAKSLKKNGFSVLWRKNNHIQSRLGVIISKRQIKTAVQRNQTRRIIRESFRHHQAQLSGYDIIVITKQQVSDQTKAEQRSVLEQLWDGLAASLANRSSG